MGLDFIRNKSAAYKQKRDSSRALIRTCDLLERMHPDRVRELFGVQLRNPSLSIEAGYRVYVQMESENKATVHQNGLVIGDMDAAAAEEISRRLKMKGKTSGVFEGLIRETQDISGHFKITPVEPQDIRIDERSPEK